MNKIRRVSVIVISFVLLLLCVGGMALADRRIRRDGFAEKTPPFITVQNHTFSVYLFGKTVVLP